MTIRHIKPRHALRTTVLFSVLSAPSLATVALTVIYDSVEPVALPRTGIRAARGWATVEAAHATAGYAQGPCHARETGGGHQ